MLKWKQFLTPVQSMEPDEARTYMAKQKEGNYTLLDVRQPGEHEKSRIPGATLVPLPELSGRLEEIDPKKPVIAYCAIGGRSRAAAQFLAGKGFKEVYNLKGGIKAWHGLTAAGTEDLGMSLFRGDEAPEEVIVLAYGMEQGLGDFYMAMAEKTEDQEVANLFVRLSKVEETHKESLLSVYLGLDQTISDKETFESKIVSNILEGGYSTEEFLEKNRGAMQTVSGVLDIAMMLETQALDLYLRYSQKITDEEGKGILFNIAEEEKAHLAVLGDLLETRG